jgi:hypothetical protein
MKDRLAAVSGHVNTLTVCQEAERDALLHLLYVCGRGAIDRAMY